MKNKWKKMRKEKIMHTRTDKLAHTLAWISLLFVHIFSEYFIQQQTNLHDNVVKTVE